MAKEKRQFLFVLKDSKNQIIGSSQILSKLGTRQIASYALKIFKTQEDSFLRLVLDRDGPSGLGGLVLHPSYRGHQEKLGKQISFIRFLFIAMQVRSFEPELQAELAPFLDHRKKNPFFGYFIQPRFSLSLKEIDHLTLTDKKRLFKYFPKGDISFSSLPLVVQKSLGKTGKSSQPAEHLLKAQNFRFTGLVDPFDCGPYIRAKTKNIPLIQKTRKVFLSYCKQDDKNRKLRKWLWGSFKGACFRGGLVKAYLKQNQLFVLEKNFLDLEEKTAIYVSPFDSDKGKGVKSRR